MALQYEIALCSVWWCAGCENVRYFNSVAEQTSYFETLASGKFSPLANFNMGNNVETTIHYKDTSGRTPEELVACNYAVIRHKNTPEGDYIYRYFFARCSQDSGTQIRAELSLDDIQTNYFKYKDTIAPCIIERAHLNRWIADSEISGNYRFNTSPGSSLFKSEGVSMPKRLLSRTKKRVLNAAEKDATNDVKSWIDNHISAWVYVFIDPSVEYTIIQPDGTTEDKITFQNIRINSKFSCEWAVLAYPLYKDDASPVEYIKIEYQDKTYVLTSTALDAFRNNNNDTSYFYAIKVERFSPLNTLSTSGSSWSIDSSNNLIIPISNISNVNPFYNIKNLDEGLLNVRIFNTNFPQIDYKLELKNNLDNNFSFPLSEITGNRSKILNPKLLSTEVTELRAISALNSFSYDPLKCGKNDLNFRYSEVLFPDITRCYLAFISNNENTDEVIYINDSAYNFTGVSASEDAILPMRNDQLQAYLASNKNFYLQRDLRYRQEDINAGMNRTRRAFNAISNALGSAVNGDLSGFASAGKEIAGEMFTEVQRKINQSFDRMQSDLTLDNMEQAPDALQNANGNILYNIYAQNDSGLYVYFEIHCALDCDIKPYDDYLYMYGFAFNEMGNMGDYDHIRKYFNYIQADIEIITAPISSLEEDRLKERFRNGVRFWNSDTIQYTLENYEIALEGDAT